MNCVEQISIDDFKIIFCDYLSFCGEKVTCVEVVEKVKKIQSKIDKIAYDKIIKKIIENVKLQELMVLIAENNFEDEYIKTLYINSENTKSFYVVPEINVAEMLINLNESDKQIYYSLTLNLCKCAILISMNPNGDMEIEETFNVLKNSSLNDKGEFTINSVVDGTPIKKESMQQYLLRTLTGKNVNINETFSDINEEKVNEAANVMHNALDGDKFKENSQTKNFLTETLGNVQNELLNFEKKDMSDVDCFDEIQNIGAKVSEKLLKNKNIKNMDPDQLIADTQKLAQEIMPGMNIMPMFEMIKKMSGNKMNGKAPIDLENIDLSQMLKLTKSQKKNMTKQQIKDARKKQKQMQNMLPPVPANSPDGSDSKDISELNTLMENL
jgi:hypothetical protein